MRERALEFLSDNPLLHMGMIAPIERGTADIFYAEKDGVCLLDTKSGAYMMSAASYETGRLLLETLPREGLFTFHQSFMLDDVKEKVIYSSLLENFQAVYFPKDELPVLKELNIKPLDMSCFEILLENYDVDVGEDYLKKRIESGELFGGYVAGALVGFAGIHAEGSIGLLNVFDAYRQKGYGSALISHMVNHQLARGFVPFEQIGADNEPSLAIARKLGFSISSEKLYWLF